ncbi:helix-turn-helix transcriptional regulator [Acinetobacter sp. Marseille-Q1618]|uniref:helix-turn-helix transcriptional regulator n=1 Tax=Acinetobacter sp. Marseille-Q1618 TaxID=2697502 RepID=UPI00156EDFF4|nr:helix-turn-helix transcriptional regulator [Acinetobacter sp. Marseille-Q1618]
MELFEKYYEELRALIYKIPLTTDGWFYFAKRLLTVLDVSYIHLQAIDMTSNIISFSNGVGVLSSEVYANAELKYLRYPVDADPRWAKFLDPERQGWYQCHTHITDDFVKNSELYQDILLPIGLRYVATKELIWDEKMCIFWSISTAEQRQPLNTQEIYFLDQLLPHLKKIIIAQRHLYELSINNIVGYNLINHLNQPIVLLSLSGQVVYYNQKMKDFFEAQNVIQNKNNQFNLPVFEQKKFFNILYKIEEAFRYKHSEIHAFRNIIFPITLSKNSKVEFTINFLASEKEKSFFGIRPLVMLTFQSYENEAIEHFNKFKHYALPHSYLESQFHLTKREFEVCELFVNGKNLEEIAQTLSLKVISIRTYIKNIFVKMHCNSQVDLMKLLIQISKDAKNK